MTGWWRRRTRPPPSVYGFGHEPYYRNVLQALRGETTPDTDGAAGRKSLELILGIYESARTGREVTLPIRCRGGGGAAIFNCLASLHFRRLFPLLRSCRTWLSRFSI